MASLDVEKSDEYKKLEYEIVVLELLEEFYLSGSDLFSFEIDKDSKVRSIRELIACMSDYELPRKPAPDDQMDVLAKVKKIREEKQVQLSEMRKGEIESKHLENLWIMNSWNDTIKSPREFLGFYLNRPVTKLVKDSILMLVSGETHFFTDIADESIELTAITGPGIMYTQFQIGSNQMLTNVLEVNMIVLPADLHMDLFAAPSLFHSSVSTNISAVLNETLSIVPFSLIEAPYGVQAMTRGVLQRNVFHPNREPLNAFLAHCKDPTSYDPEQGFKILSAHPFFHNHLMLSRPIQTEGDASYGLASAGLSRILVEANKILPDIFDDGQKVIDLLPKFRVIADHYLELGQPLLDNWMPR